VHPVAFYSCECAALHFYENILTGLDCGLSFGNAIVKDAPARISVLLIPTAMGGSSISQWLGDSIHRDVKLLTNFKEKVVLGKNMIPTQVMQPYL
jgi:hypothetical protein